MIFSSYNSLIDKCFLRRLVYIIILIVEFVQYLAYVLPATIDSYKDDSLFIYDIIYYVDVCFFLTVFFQVRRDRVATKNSSGDLY